MPIRLPNLLDDTKSEREQRNQCRLWASVFLEGVIWCETDRTCTEEGE